MSNFRVNYKELFESITCLKIYPVVIPQNANYPCIQMTTSGGARDTSSNLAKTNITSHRIILTICSDKVSTNVGYEKMLLDAIDYNSNVYKETKSLIIEHAGTTELFNYTQNLHEMTIEFKTKILKLGV